MDTATAQSRKDVDTNDSNSDKSPQNTIIFGDLNRHNQSHTSQSSDDCQAPLSTVPIPPDGGWGWVVVFASFMINFIADGVSLSFGILFVDLVECFGESKAKTSWVGSIFLSMPLLAGPIASYLSDRFGCQKICILGALLAALAFILSIFADSLELLFLTFSIAGLGLALCYVTSIVVVAYYFEKKRSLATGLSACGTGIGTFVFPPITIYLLKEYGWQGTLLIMAGFFLNMVIFGALMRDLPVPAKPNDKKLYVADEINDLEDSERLCSSLVQLPTYLCDNLPVEVISELSTKEGGYLNSLLEQHPDLLRSHLNLTVSNNEKKLQSTSPDFQLNQQSKLENTSIVSDKMKTNLQLTQDIDEKVNPKQNPKVSSLAGKLDGMAYLRNMRFQRGSITYRGAMLNIHRYRLRASSCPDIYRNSMLTIRDEKFCFCFEDLKEMMYDMFDLSIFKNIRYTLFCISNFLLYACVDVPYVYLPDHAYTRGNDKESASFLISILGVLNTLGVVIVGFIGDKPWIEPSMLYSGFILLSGVSLVLLPVVANFFLTASLVGIYGFTISANYTLVPIIIVNLISLDSFTGAYGLLLLVQGIASLVGPPIAGTLFDLSGNYDITFFCTGVCIIVSGAMMLPVANRSNVGSASDKANKETGEITPRFESVHFETSKDQETMSLPVLDSLSCLEAENGTLLPLLTGVNKFDTNISDFSSVAESGEKISIYNNPLSCS